MKPNEQIQKTFDIMQKDMDSKGYVCIVAYYIRPKGVDIDKVSAEQSMGRSHHTLTLTHYDLVSFQKYLDDNLFNTKSE